MRYSSVIVSNRYQVTRYPRRETPRPMDTLCPAYTLRMPIDSGNQWPRGRRDARDTRDQGDDMMRPWDNKPSKRQGTEDNEDPTPPMSGKAGGGQDSGTLPPKLSKANYPPGLSSIYEFLKVNEDGCEKNNL